MMYPYITLDDGTEIVHSEMREDGTVKVYVETPDDKGGFHNATCILPDYKWENIEGYSKTEIEYFIQIIREQGMPFEITRETPNSETLVAIKEVEEMKKNPSLGKPYTNIDEMMEDQLLKLRHKVMKAEKERVTGKSISISEARKQIHQRVEQKMDSKTSSVLDKIRR